MNREKDALNEQDWKILNENDLIHRKRRTILVGFDDSPPSENNGYSEHSAISDTVLYRIPLDEEYVSEDSEHGLQPSKSWDNSNEEEEDFPPSEELDSSILDEDIKYDDSNPEESSMEWINFVSEFDEFNEYATREGYTNRLLVDGKISRIERAEQVAITLSQEYKRNNSEIPLLTELFDTQSYGPTKTAVERLFTQGIDSEELELVILLRDFWNSRLEFSISLGYKSLNARMETDSIMPIFRMLSWPTALRLIRVTVSLPDVAELERLLDELYTTWYCSQRLRSAFSAFYYYLLQWLDHMELHPELCSTWPFEFEDLSDAFDSRNVGLVSHSETILINKELE